MFSNFKKINDESSLSLNLKVNKIDSDSFEIPSSLFNIYAGGWPLLWKFIGESIEKRKIYGLNDFDFIAKK